MLEYFDRDFTHLVGLADIVEVEQNFSGGGGNRRHYDLWSGGGFLTAFGGYNNV
jgi:hypothetical protein